MKSIVLFFLGLLLGISNTVFAQFNGNTTPTYHELIDHYRVLSDAHPELTLFNMGSSDYGLPIYLFIINGSSDSLSTIQKAARETTVLINNGIHPGEPDGINACLLWVNDWIKNGKKTKELPVIAIIPAYNVGGMMRRSGTSRANQEGPEEYGFRGNARNLDLNRDFIKMDARNTFTFAKIFHAIRPDVFIDTHVSNGADYQHTLTYISSVKNRLAPSIRKITYDDLLPDLRERLSNHTPHEHMIPYVLLTEEVPENGISAFNDLPRYSMGYAALFHAISLTVETHMLKPFPKRTRATLAFLEHTFSWISQNKRRIERARDEAFQFDQRMETFPFNFELSKDHVDSLLFMGYTHSYPQSKVTGLKRLKYHKDQPFTRYIPFYTTHLARDSIMIPSHYLLGAECSEVAERLAANGVILEQLKGGEVMEVLEMRVINTNSPKQPFEGHFLHSNAEVTKTRKTMIAKKGDYLIRTNQPYKRFILSVLEPRMPDSYFAWNFFDSYLQQKEYFSPYVFEEKAQEILQTNTTLKTAFELKRSDDPQFRASSWDQLYFIYRHSPYYEPSHNVLPLFSVFSRN